MQLLDLNPDGSYWSFNKDFTGYPNSVADAANYDESVAVNDINGVISSDVDGNPLSGNGSLAYGLQFIGVIIGSPCIRN